MKKKHKGVSKDKTRILFLAAWIATRTNRATTTEGKCIGLAVALAEYDDKPIDKNYLLSAIHDARMLIVAQQTRLS